ncbi:kynurenine 3-monooxygenase, partial [Asbolus verrucosus]
MSGNNTIIIIGGGLVGSLCAIFMARRGYSVTVFEYRNDIRLDKFVHGRSINLALSNRGRSALSAVQLENLILKSAIPMKGRLLHSIKGETKNIPYDNRSNQCIYSVGRNYLNGVLLTEMEKYPNVKICFNHKLIRVNFEEEVITILDLKTQEAKTCYADLIVGADGAFSTLRRFMQQTPLFEFNQTYIKHGYLELTIPAERGNKMVPNHLHIWPREEFMMIALPNEDSSWTVTLFMPFTSFESLNNETKLRNFFHTVFPDAVPLIGENLLVSDFFRVQPSPLISVKCNPHHVGSKFLIIGDAAHAMVPFYGQGMNAGFEDCLLFDNILCENQNDIARSIRQFSFRRVQDAHAICELAMYNYVEMRDLITRRPYYIRKFVDELLFGIFPRGWIPLYNSVTFTDIPYEKCTENRKWQDK